MQSDFVKLDDAGNELPRDATLWSQVLDRSTGLIWAADPLDGKFDWKAAGTAAAGLVLGGNAWRLPSMRELQSVVDYDRFNPAINTDFFRCPVDWYWSSSVVASDPRSCAWDVHFDYGYCGIYDQDYEARVRAVRSAPLSSQ